MKYRIKLISSYYKYRNLLKKISQETLNDDGYILFNTIRQYTVQMHIEYFMAFLLAKKGHNIIVLLDDGVLNHWDSVHANNIQGAYTPFKSNFYKKLYTKLVSRFIQLIYKHKLIKTIYLSDILYESKKIIVDNLKYSKISHDIAKSSSRRYTSELDFWSNYTNQDYFKKSYENCEIFIPVTHFLLRKYQIKKLITSHGIYSTWGMIYEICKSENVPCLIYSELIYREQYMLLADSPHQKLADSNDWRNILDSNNFELKEDLKEKAIAFLDKRVSYKGDDSKYYFNDYELQDLQIKRKDKCIVYGMFPNIVWDGDIEEWHIIFDGILDWVLKTIKIIRDTSDILVIRCHPSESKLVTWAAGLEDLIRASIKDIDEIDNVIIISSDFDLNIYKFVEDQIDIGLVYDGMIGMEMVHLNKPVITAGNGRYAGSNFSYEPKNLNEYTNLIRQRHKTIKDFKDNLFMKKQRLNRFIYWYLYEKSFKLPILSKKDFFGIDFEELCISDIDNSNEDLQRTINFLGK